MLNRGSAAADSAITRTLPAGRLLETQLVNEIRDIYAAVVLVESKCIEFYSENMPVPGQPLRELTDAHWQAICQLYIMVLHEYYDFFLATTHPSATEAIQNLAAKYGMAARDLAPWRSRPLHATKGLPTSHEGAHAQLPQQGVCCLHYAP